MEIAYDGRDFQRWMMHGHEISKDAAPLLIDRFLNNAVEVDVDALSDGEQVVIAGMMEQIQEAGVHSGDSRYLRVAAHDHSRPRFRRSWRRARGALALELKVQGLINIQWAIEDGKVFILEVNPRASRTIPFVSKARDIAFSKIAMKVMMGRKQGGVLLPEWKTGLVYVKEAVLAIA